MLRLLLLLSEIREEIGGSGGRHISKIGCKRILGDDQSLYFLVLLISLILRLTRIWSRYLLPEMLLGLKLNSFAINAELPQNVARLTSSHDLNSQHFKFLLRVPALSPSLIQHGAEIAHLQSLLKFFVEV